MTSLRSGVKMDLMKKTTVIINNIIRVNTLHIFLIHAFFFDKKIPRIDNNIRDNMKHNPTVILPEAVSAWPNKKDKI